MVFEHLLIYIKSFPCIPVRNGSGYKTDIFCAMSFYKVIQRFFKAGSIVERYRMISFKVREKTYDRDLGHLLQKGLLGLDICSRTDESLKDVDDIHISLGRKIEDHVVLIFILPVSISAVGLADVMAREHEQIGIDCFSRLLGSYCRLIRKEIVDIVYYKSDIQFTPHI